MLAAPTYHLPRTWEEAGFSGACDGVTPEDWGCILVQKGPGKSSSQDPSLARSSLTGSSGLRSRQSPAFPETQPCCGDRERRSERPPGDQLFHKGRLWHRLTQLCTLLGSTSAAWLLHLSLWHVPHRAPCFPRGPRQPWGAEGPTPIVHTKPRPQECPASSHTCLTSKPGAQPHGHEASLRVHPSNHGASSIQRALLTRSHITLSNNRENYHNAGITQPVWLSG